MSDDKRRDECLDVEHGQEQSQSGGMLEDNAETRDSVEFSTAILWQDSITRW